MHVLAIEWRCFIRPWIAFTGHHETQKWQPVQVSVILNKSPHPAVQITRKIILYNNPHERINLDLTRLSSQNTPIEPNFWVRDIPIYGDLILSPMDGLSDLPFRSIARQLGSAMSYTEFINAIDVLSKHPDLARRLSFYESERPLVYQIFDDDPDRLVKAAQKLTQKNPDIIDVNLGCSARTVTGRGAGAALLREPEKIARIISCLTRSISIPVTAKIRLGWDEQSMNYLDIARIIEDNGAQLIAVHGRTKKQGYTGQASWLPIAEIKQAVKIPVIANGDVRTVDDIDRIKEITGCDGVMIGRAAIDNPWIFSRRERNQVSIIELENLMIEHLNKSIAFYGPARGLVLFRKYAKRLMSPLNLDRDRQVELLTIENPVQFLEQLHITLFGENIRV